ncbi:AAA family ATPase [Streptomonospora wellingtoniae]|uniref:AAA family ATPase n=1 Tax=Streptomonospora wellingtoniae TaxID=3075544 RepID=A0ABU2KNF5_9ACTN|nr:AAA family ATPase [Streptomonospora sp. DSM 45055]MDT0300801.1 AAA family ATPase [Streptomonospora sp. DSM 45055]
MNPLICARCGEFTDRPGVDAADPAGAVLYCADCGHREPFRRLPLLCVTGPSGTGKSTVARLLLDSLSQRFVVLEQDLLWTGGLRDSDTEHPLFRTTWLRTAAMIQQNGRPVVLCGTVVPPEFEDLPERALFSDIRYLALTCDPEVLATRLRARPAWRQWDEPRIAEMLDYARWVEESAHEMEPPVELLDTTGVPAERTADQVARWAVRAASANDAPPAPDQRSGAAGVSARDSTPPH